MLFGELVLLQDAALRYAMDHMVKKGFTAVDPPLLVRDGAMLGTAFFPGGRPRPAAGAARAAGAAGAARAVLGRAAVHFEVGN